MSKSNGGADPRRVMGRRPALSDDAELRVERCDRGSAVLDA